MQEKSFTFLVIYFVSCLVMATSFICSSSARLLCTLDDIVTIVYLCYSTYHSFSKKVEILLKKRFLNYKLYRKIIN
jgi:hypothetical protein